MNRAIDPLIDSVMRQNMEAIQGTYWPAMCDSIRSHAKAMGRRRTSFAADLMMNVAELFCGLQEPTSIKEVSARQLQSITVGGIIGDLAHADGMTRYAPNAVDAIASAMIEYAGCDLELQGPMSSIEFGSRIGAICNSAR